MFPGQNVSILTEKLHSEGLGFSSVSPKLVAKIITGKYKMYVDLSDLFATNLVQSEPGPHLLLDGWLMLTMSPKTTSANRRCAKLDRGIDCFFALVLTTYLPQCHESLLLTNPSSDVSEHSHWNP